jgi:hypothetical protein
MTLELLIGGIPFGCQLGLRNATRPTSDDKLAFLSGINTASASVDDDSLDSMVFMGDFLCGLGRWFDEYEVTPEVALKKIQREEDSHSENGNTPSHFFITSLSANGSYRTVRCKYCSISCRSCVRDRPFQPGSVEYF